MRFHPSTLILPLLMLGFIEADRLAAQAGAGSLKGTVTDSSGAFIPVCKIHLTNSQTNISRDDACSPAGDYFFGSLRPAPTF